MDLRADGEEVPNNYGLRASDFHGDMASYRAALGFLGDLTVGCEEAEALRAEGATPEMLRGWEGSARFRRALGKCRAAGQADREWQAAREQEASDPYRTPPRPGWRGWFRDPFRIGASQEERSPLALLGLTKTAQAAEPESAKPGESRFVRIEDLSDAQVIELRMQNQPEPKGEAWGPGGRPDAQRFPWPTDGRGNPLALQRGALSAVPGAETHKRGGN